MENTDSKPWYKYFWPWFLIAVPASSFVMAYFLVGFATNTQDSLVVDDYYKEGKAINANRQNVRTAKRLGILTDLTIDKGNIALTFHAGIPENGNALNLTFYHVTLAQKDFSIMLTRDANGIYRAYTEQPLSGKWRISLTPLDEEWKVQQDISLPHSGAIRFKP